MPVRKFIPPQRDGFWLRKYRPEGFSFDIEQSIITGYPFTHVPGHRLQVMPLSKITAASLHDTAYIVDPIMVSREN